MNSQPSGDLARFLEFATQQVEKHGETGTPEEVLDLWRRSNPTPNDYEETVRALREALDDVADGDQGIPLAEFDRQFREKQRVAQQSTE